MLLILKRQIILSDGLYDSCLNGLLGAHKLPKYLLFLKTAELNPVVLLDNELTDNCSILLKSSSSDSLEFELESTKGLEPKLLKYCSSSKSSLKNECCF